MGKIRVYELADQLNMQSKELVGILQDLGMDITSHMSTVDAETAELVQGMLNDENEEKETENEEEDKEIDNEENITVEENDKEEIRPPITVKELAEKIDYEANQIIKKLIDLGIMANLNHTLNQEVLEMLQDELNLAIVIKSQEEEDSTGKINIELEEDREELQLRPPVVTVMGHVDHGKTTLLDSIREARVVDSEAGGITQHIGAYQVEYNNQKITFVDTPGHEAFTAMRARGAQITDIVILVVAADDGVMPQTVEAINHAQAADIPLLVAVNKIDKNNAQPQRVKQEMSEHGLVPEDWGGQTICVNVSALKNENIDELLEMVLLVSEMEEIKANPDKNAEGFIIEAELDKTRGPVATILVKNGTLYIGDALLAGSACGKVRAMHDDRGNIIDAAPPSTPVEVLGFSDVPAAGDYVQVIASEKEARNIAEKRKETERQKKMQKDTKISLEDIYQQIQKGELKELNIILKADVQGSIEALRDSLTKLSTEEVGVNIIHTGVGGINETDVNLASASNGIIIGFNVRPDSNAQILADKESVEIQTYRVIYKVIEDVKDAMAGLLEPELKEVIKGRAEVRDTFNVPEVGTIAGAYVRNGLINRNNKIRIIRDGVVIHEGEIDSLKRFEDDVREVNEGYECGVGIENYNDIKVGDILEIYDYKEIKRSL
ncbi:MAG: translation initiation factor IF-2 [Bacillota bacterium]